MKTGTLWKFIHPILVCLFLAILLCAPNFQVNAQQGDKVQIIIGDIFPGELDVYLLEDLQKGQTLYVYADAVSGDLDPFVGLLKADDNFQALLDKYQNDFQIIINSGIEMVSALDEVRNRFFLAWDDDSGEGYASQIAYQIPQDGDYRITVSGALSSTNRLTSGEYNLIVGIDAPQVLEGQSAQQEEPFVVYDSNATPINESVTEITGIFDNNTRSQSYRLNNFKPDDTFYAYVEAIEGDLKPTLILRDYGDKPLAASNLNSLSSKATLQHQFAEGGNQFTLQVAQGEESSQDSTGSYRLLLGKNTPEVLKGDAPITESSTMVSDSIPVQVGFKLQQIVDMDQQNEFFTAVGTLRMEWVDPVLAFSPDTCGCRFKIYTDNSFSRFLSENNDQWPDFTFFNQQGNRWIQNRVIVVRPNGSTTYVERFTTNFQVDFDFRLFPFDQQTFLIRVDQILPEDYYKFNVLPDYSEVSPESGEDEFILSEAKTEVSTIPGSTGLDTSRFTFSFDGPRHLDYYVFQIFIPIGLIMFISWVTFFLKDYTRRIEVSGANVLLFIAFNFSLADNYPRLGYITLLDAIMAVTFIFNTAVVVYNVYLKYLEQQEKEDLANRIDTYLDYLYPVLYLGLLGIVWVVFFF